MKARYEFSAADQRRGAEATHALRRPTDGRITASEAAARYGLKLWTLCRAIDAGTVPGERREFGQRVIRTVIPAELETYLANRPKCGYEGCEKRAGVGSEACSGPHARALETKGRKRPAETCRKIAAGKTDKPRPDVRERVAAMHADKEQHYRWNVALAEGRVRISAPDKAAEMKRRAKLRLNGLLGARAAGRVAGKRPVEQLYPDKAARALTLRRNGESLRAIALDTGLTKREVEGIMARAALLSP